MGLLFRNASANGLGAACAIVALAVMALATPAAADFSQGVRDQIVEYVRQQPGQGGAHVQVPELRGLLPEGADPAALRVDLSSRSRASAAGSLPVTVVLSEGGRELKRTVVTAMVKHRQRVWTATRALQRGEILRKEDLVHGILDVSRRNEKTPKLSALLGKRLRRSVRPGTPVRESFVEVVPAVSRGESVRLILRAGPLRIEAEGRATSNATTGQRIRVLNKESRREVWGRVGPDGAVHVDF